MATRSYPSCRWLLKISVEVFAALRNLRQGGRLLCFSGGESRNCDQRIGKRRGGDRCGSSPWSSETLLTVSPGSEYDQISADWLDVPKTAVFSGASVATAAEAVAVNASQYDGNLDAAGNRWLVRLTPERRRSDAFSRRHRGRTHQQLRAVPRGGWFGSTRSGVGRSCQCRCSHRGGSPRGQSTRRLVRTRSEDCTASNEPPNDTLYSFQAGLNNIGQGGGTADADIDAPEAWNVTTGSSDIVVAVIDSGIDYNHPDLVRQHLDQSRRDLRQRHRRRRQRLRRRRAWLRLSQQRQRTARRPSSRHARRRHHRRARQQRHRRQRCHLDHVVDGLEVLGQQQRRLDRRRRAGHQLRHDDADSNRPRSGQYPA